MSFAGALAQKAQIEQALIGCIREFQNSLEDSVYSLMVDRITKIGIPGFRVLSNKIDHRSGGGFRFKGLSRSIEAVKSMHGFKIFWLEEGQFISEQSLKILTPTLREEGSELWISANPLSSADPFAQRFILPFQKQLNKFGYYEDELHYIVKINYSDNPWFPEVLEMERQHDFKYLPRAQYDHIWEGEFNDSVEDSIVRAEWFDAAINAHEKLGFKPRGAVIASFDPADIGGDDKGYALRKGSVLLDARRRKFGEVADGADWALDLAINNQADLFSWDCDGIGLGIKRQIETALKGKQMRFFMFKGSESPFDPHKIYKPLLPASSTKIDHKERTNKQTFKNKRAQKYWDLRDRLYATYLAVEKGVYIDPDDMLSISPDIEDLKQLRSEVCRIPRKYNATGLLQIASKPEMKVMKIQSPNMADSVMMSLVTPKTWDDEELDFDTVF